MKKLMIAAAAAAMVGGAFALPAPTTIYTWNTDSRALFDGVKMGTIQKGTTNIIHNYVGIKKDSQIVIIKEKAYANKFFCLNNEKNVINPVCKPSAVSTRKHLALDGVVYYNGTSWVGLRWNKDQQDMMFWGFRWKDRGRNEGEWTWTSFSDVTEGQYKLMLHDTSMKGNYSPWSFQCYYAPNGKTIWGGVEVAEKETYVDGKVVAYNAVTKKPYGLVDAKTKMVKNMKTTDASIVYTLKTYKDIATLKNVVKSFSDKYEKAGGKKYNFKEEQYK